MSKNLDWFDYHNKNFGKKQMEHFYELHDEMTSMEHLLKQTLEAEDYDELIEVKNDIQEFFECLTKAKK